MRPIFNYLTWGTDRSIHSHWGFVAESLLAYIVDLKSCIAIPWTWSDSQLWQLVIPYPPPPPYVFTTQSRFSLSLLVGVIWFERRLQEASKNYIQVCIFLQEFQEPKIQREGDKCLSFNEHNQKDFPLQARTGSYTQQTWIHHPTLFNPKVKEQKQRDDKVVLLCACVSLSCSLGVGWQGCTSACVCVSFLFPRHREVLNFYLCGGWERVWLRKEPLCIEERTAFLFLLFLFPFLLKTLMAVCLYCSLT